MPIYGFFIFSYSLVKETLECDRWYGRGRGLRWEGSDALADCGAHWGLPVGFLLLRYSVLFTVQSLSLLYLLFIS